MQEDSSLVYKVEEVMRALKISRSKVYDLLDGGELERCELSSPARITAESVRRQAPGGPEDAEKVSNAMLL